MSKPPPPMLTLREFVEGGLLQEVNRRFFHPLGLALAVTAPDGESDESHELLDQKEFQAMVWDGRDDPEGFYFGYEESKPERLEKAREKFKAVEDLRLSKQQTRLDNLGFDIEPIPD